MLDAHEKPPDVLRSVYKKYQKLSSNELTADVDIIDFRRGLSEQQQKLFTVVECSRPETLRAEFQLFLGDVEELETAAQINAYHHLSLPDLIIIPNLIPLTVQKAILSKLLHRDLVCPEHKTNIHLHYDISYPQHKLSFFDFDPSALVVAPKDSSVHRPLTAKQLLAKKLRWMTLGGQYDWTRKVYPDGIPPSFPPDLSTLLQGIFPETNPQAAIVNLYSPGDTLSLHRDVSETSDRGLISLSIGCDALFVIGSNEDPSNYAALRIHSGDVVYMAGPARFAWHGVPMIVPNTCPDTLKLWPAQIGDETVEGQYKDWANWMQTKRVNLNVRQMS